MPQSNDNYIPVNTHIGGRRKSVPGPGFGAFLLGDHVTARTVQKIPPERDFACFTGLRVQPERECGSSKIPACSAKTTTLRFSVAILAVSLLLAASATWSVAAVI